MNEIEEEVKKILITGLDNCGKSLINQTPKQF